MDGCPPGETPPSEAEHQWKGPPTQEGGIPSLSFSSFASSPALTPASFAQLSCWVGLNPLEGRSALVTHCWVAAKQSEADAGYLVGFRVRDLEVAQLGGSCLF